VSIAVEGVTLFCCWLLVRSAGHKFRSPGYYLDLIARLVPALPMGRCVVLLIAIAESSLAILLLIPLFRGLALTGFALLMLVYAAVMTWQLWQGGSAAPCGCSGPGSRLLVAPALVVRNACCAFIALLATLPQSSGVQYGYGSILAACFLYAIYYVSEQWIAGQQYMEEEI
jgi:hypothetical protein